MNIYVIPGGYTFAAKNADDAREFLKKEGLNPNEFQLAIEAAPKLRKEWKQQAAREMKFELIAMVLLIVLICGGTTLFLIIG